MRVALPFSLFCASLLVAVTAEAGYGSGYDFSYGDPRAIQLQKTISVVAEQKAALQRRVDMLQTQKSRLNRRLRTVTSSLLPSFDTRLEELDIRLASIVLQLKEQSHSVDLQSARMARERLVAQEQEAMVNPRWNRILELTDRNTRHAAQIAKINTTIIESMRILYDKLNDARAIGTSRINEVIENTKSSVDYVNSRYCYIATATVEVSQNGTGSTVVDYPEGYFPGTVPTSYCVLKGFETHLDLGKSYPYRPDNEKDGVGSKVICKSFPRSVVVDMFDNSKGDINSIKTAYISVWVCAFGAQSSYGPLDPSWR